MFEHIKTASRFNWRWKVDVLSNPKGGGQVYILDVFRICVRKAAILNTLGVLGCLGDLCLGPASGHESTQLGLRSWEKLYTKNKLKTPYSFFNIF